MACNKYFWGEACASFLHKYKSSKHCYEEGEKRKEFKLKLICCVDTDWGNINSVTGYHFFGHHGFFFEDENKNFYQTNSVGFYEFSYKNENEFSLEVELTIKGKTEIVPLDIEIIHLANELIQIKTDLDFSRTLFNIGTGKWKSTAILKDKGVIKTNLFLFKQE